VFDINNTQCSTLTFSGAFIYF